MKPSAASADLRFGANPPSSPTLVDEPGVLQRLLERVEDFRAHAHGVRARRRGDRHDHELLDVDRVVGMHPAVDDVHHRHRQQVRRRAADIAVERQAARDGCGLGGRERNTQNCVGAEPALVLGAVELDEGGVDAALVLGVHAGKRVENLAVDAVDSLGDALAEVARLVSVTQLDCLVRTRRGARGHTRTAERAVLEHDVDLHRRVAAAVEDLAADDVDDGGHFALPYGCGARGGVGGSGAF